MSQHLFSSRQRQPAECIIKLGASKREMTDLYPYLTQVTVSASRIAATTATIELETRRDERCRWSVQDAGILAPWKSIRIEAAFGDHTEEVMRGYVREIDADYPEDAGSSKVKVVVQDESLSLDREHRRRAWGAETPTTDAAILRKILQDYPGLELHGDSQEGLTGIIVNQNCTDIQLLRGRARVNGYELTFRESKVYFGPMRLRLSAQPSILVYAGWDTHCYRISIKDDGHHPDAVGFDLPGERSDKLRQAVIAPDLPALGRERADSSNSGLRPFVWRLDRVAGVSEPQLRALAKARANEQAMKIRAEGELDGSRYRHVLHVGLPVGLEGVGNRYGGQYYVDTVVHRFDTNGYRQTFKLLRNAYGDNLASASSALAPLI
jgi:phage protein D